jgi:hypothetical protein
MPLITDIPWKALRVGIGDPLCWFKEVFGPLQGLGDISKPLCKRCQSGAVQISPSGGGEGIPQFSYRDILAFSSRLSNKSLRFLAKFARQCPGKEKLMGKWNLPGPHAEKHLPLQGQTVHTMDSKDFQ